MNKSIKITGSLLAKNTALNFFAQIVPLIVALVTIPYVIHGLGTERFGILSLIWVVIGYFSILNMGLGQATTKFVAEALGKEETERIPAIVWTSLTSQLLLGVLGCIILVLATPTLVERVLNIPPDFIEEAKNTFYILSLSIPIVICSASLNGVLEAAQRFDLVNAVTVPSSCLNFLLPAIGIFLDLKLPGIVILLLILRAATLGVYLILCFRVYPKIRQVLLIDTKMLRPLFSFGGWVTISSILIPILVYIDRFFIGALYTIAAVGYYSVSYDMVSRLTIFSRSFSATLFPAFSTIESDKDKLKQLYARSFKYILLIMGPIVLVLIIFAGDILHVWLGGDWASETTLVFQILAIGMLIDGLSRMPANLFDGIGRADLRAKIYLLSVFIYVGLAWFLISKMGIMGAALAWTLRACLELSLFFSVAWKVIRLKRAIFMENGILRGVMAYGGLVAITLFVIVILGKTLLIQSIVTTICLSLFALVTWRYVLDVEDKQPLFLAIKRTRGWGYRLNEFAK
ncbi:MAG TPA: flippase [Candidatus Brocadiia bacterium]|nr:flippase [Candidatus Brocadiales bacterium]